VDKVYYENSGDIRYTAQKFHYLANIDVYPFFRTFSSFDLNRYVSGWSIELQAYFFSDAYEDDGDNELEGEISVVTSDDVKHLVAKWSHKKTDKKYAVSNQSIDDTWGSFLMVFAGGGAPKYFYIFYLPNGQAYKDGVKRIVMKHTVYNKYGQGGAMYWVQYEKDIQFSGIAADKPMPNLTIDWDTEGNLTYKATGVPYMDWEDQFYDLNLYYNDNGWKNSNVTIGKMNNGFAISNENKSNWTMDVAFSYWPLVTSASSVKAAYTVPVYVSYQGGIENDSHSGIHDPGIDGYRNFDGVFRVSQPTVDYGFIRPYTRPKSVAVEFDKWSKKNIVTWTRQEKVTGYNGSNTMDVECRTTGKWYVIRYDNGKSADNYELVGSLNGDATQLSLADEKIIYGKQYVYRVIFLPDILESKYKDNLTKLPGYNRAHNDTDLWEEQSGSTKLDVPITLTQDKTYDKDVFLKWQYSIPLQGLAWTIEYKKTGEKTWLSKTETIPLDPNETEASSHFSGTVCDPITYRIKTSVDEDVIYSDTLSTTLPSGSYISDVTATTGTEETEVKVKWKVKNPDIVNDIYYRVLRRPIGAEGPDSWTELTSSVHGTATEYEYTDTRPLAGTYYEYTVEAYGAKCGDQLMKSDAVVTPGFSQARGTITGHISFGSGTAVAGVRVNLVKSSTDDANSQPQFLSRRIDGEGAGLQWRANSEKYDNVLNGQQPLTLQLWARPQSTLAGGASQQQLVQIAGALELGVKESGGRFHLYAIDRSKGGTTVKEFTSLVFDNIDFTHVAAVYSGGAWTFYVGSETLQKATMTAAGTTWNAVSSTTATLPTLSIGGPAATRSQGSGFKGFVDDVRLWQRALTEAEITENYIRIQGGTESGMVLYWPFDEGLSVQRYAFDIARQDGLYQLNHPEVGVNVVPDASCPQHLKLYGMTDSEGDYIIKGVPFQQGGTNYKIVPELGIHEFAPATRTMFVSPTSLTANNIDFEDVSSFPMQGRITYAGTNIPVEGIRLYVDGELQTKQGKVVETDANGRYLMSVPIGKHYVEASLDGHTMVAGGRFPLQDEHNFDGPVVYDFQDSTLVNFVGRVSGATKNDTLAVGFGASNNNIGVAKITLKLNNESQLFNYYSDQVGTEERPFQSDTTAIRSHAWAGKGSDAKYIYIETDSTTGEFSALLPPMKYIVKSITIPSTKDNIEFTTLPQIDLTSVKKELKDSLRLPTAVGDSVWHYYTYNTKMVKTHFAEPQLVMTQQNGGAGFGEREMLKYAVSPTVTQDIKDIWTREDDGSIKYNYDYPVFARNKEYKFDVRGYEVYTNYDSGTARNDTVAMNGLVVTVANEMSNIQDVVARVIDPTQTEVKDGAVVKLKRTQLRLDKDGTNTITFTTGAPNVTYPYTRHFSMTYERNNRTYSGQQLDAIVLGELTNGDNFVTAGPDHVDMVLRDPPGANSKVTWKTGSSNTKLYNSVDGAYLDEDVAVDMMWGTNISTAVGLGVAIISSTDAHQTLSVGQEGSYSWQTREDSTFVTTTASDISSSTGMKYVGAKGDLFIGKSHNYIIGTCRKLGFHLEAGGIVLGLKEAVSVNDSISTDFIFSTREIEETMIPKLTDSRNSLLEYADSLVAVNYKNTTENDVYLTWKKPSDSDYGEEGTYVWKPGTKGRSQDMVLYYNQSVKNWRQRLADNEQDKVEAMAARDKYLKENRSFDGGNSYVYSVRHDSIYASTYETSTKVGGKVSFQSNIFVNYAASFGMNIEADVASGYIGSSVVGDENDNRTSYAEFEYELNDGNPGTDFSVDIYKSPRGWGDIFVLRGGQSYNPYEGEVLAEYYEPEKKHVISYGTERMEQPVIRISTDGEIGATSATLTDIPAGGTGQFTLHLTNGTTTNQTVPFTYILEIAEIFNQQGLQVLMDGVPADGRGIYIPAGETVKKVITVRQTDQSVLDYEGVTIWFESMYQPFTIYDECKLNVHFKPSSSPIDLAIQEPVLNNDREDGILDMKLSGFNRQFKNLKNVGVQYRFQGNTQWTDLFTWWVNPTDTIGRDTVSNALLPESGDLLYAAKMKSNLSFPEGDYQFRAFTTTPYGTELVSVYSDPVAVTKDMTRPRNLYTPAPANGILGYGDQLAIEFNEDIVPGYVGDDNIIVTAKLNSRQVNHDVAYQIIPFLDMPRTVNPVFLKGDFAIDFWLNWHDPGTILHQGAGTDNFALGIDDAGHVKVTIAKAQFVSTDTVPKDEWVFFALSYNATKMTFDILAQYGETTVDLFENEPVTTQNVQVVNYATDNHLYLGYIWADIHGLSLYNICHDVHEAAATKYQAKDNYIYGLANYWPMDEGHGSIAADQRHTHDFAVYDSWTLNNRNYSLRINKPEGAQADITRVGTGQGDSYAIEMWYTKSGAKDEVVFETATPTVDGDLLADESKLRLRYDSLQSLVLDYGKKSIVVASHEDFPDLRRWHHVALNVVRGQAASFYLDGQRTAVIAERDVPPIEGTRLVIGKASEIQAFADEVRIWHAALSESRLLGNIYNTIDTADVYSRGLVAYYPFEKTGEENGVTTKVATMENMAPNLSAGSAKEIVFDKDNLMDHTPPLKNAPDETRLIASPVASERKVVINLTGAGISSRDIEGTTLNVTVDRVHDLHGNTSLPIRWTAYVQQNTLKWTKDSVTIIKQYGDDYTFDVVIENKSGSTEYYKLYNMPQWLTLVDSESSDALSPLSTKILRFEVNPLVAVGNYDVTIGLQGKARSPSGRWIRRSTSTR